MPSAGLVGPMELFPSRPALSLGPMTEPSMGAGLQSSVSVWIAEGRGAAWSSPDQRAIDIPGPW